MSIAAARRDCEQLVYISRDTCMFTYISGGTALDAYMSVDRGVAAEDMLQLPGPQGGVHRYRWVAVGWASLESPLAGANGMRAAKC